MYDRYSQLEARLTITEEEMTFFKGEAEKIMELKKKIHTLQE